MGTPIDIVLSQWKSYLTNISSNLMELSEQTEFQIIKLKAKDTTNGYTGLTKVRAEQCVESLGALWQHFALLSEVVEKAVSLYNKNSFLNNTEDDVRQLLENNLIVIETERININNRNLLSKENNEKRATPQQLLKHMQDTFEKLCDDVKEISQAAETVETRLNNIKMDISRLNTTVKRLGINSIPVFDVDKIAKIESDPLQGSIELDKLVYNIEKFRASIRTVEEDYKKVIDTLNNAREMLSELEDLSVKSQKAMMESEKIFDRTMNYKPVISREVFKSLQDWAQVLEKRLSEGYLSAVKVGVSKLEQECREKLETEKENCSFNSKAYNEWNDFKGQFKALLAKADVLKSRGLLTDGSIEQLIVDMRTVLYAIPVNLENCRQLIRKLELRLR